jgi:ribulose-5-phosphate 4-epimerase/fuculose-1-phosphate aldolase
MLNAYKNLTNAIVNRVNNTIRPTNKTLEILASKKVRKEFVDQVTFGVQRNLLLNAVSEVSIRLQRDFLLTYKPGSLLSDIQEEDLVYYSFKTGQIQKSLDLPGHLDWHQSIYQNEEANAVVISHPVYLFKHFSKISQGNEKRIFRTFDFQPGIQTCSLGVEIKSLFAQHPYILVEGCGLVAWGARLDEVLANIEYLNWLCSFDLD